MKKVWLVGLSLMAAAALLIAAIVYWTHGANTLPHYFPGYTTSETTVHIKHGLAAVILAIGALILAWFGSAGNKPQRTSKTTEESPPASRQ